MENYIPIIDFSVYGPDKQNVKEEDLKDLADEVHQALSNVGFMYLKNHGIPKNIIERAENISDHFFALEISKKEKYSRDENYNGWNRLGLERTNPERPGDYKEAFDVTTGSIKLWPDEEVPGFKQTFMDFHHQCDALSLRIMEIIAIGLGLPRMFFTECHNTFEKSNPTVMRLLHYPAIGKMSELKAGQVRCGEHSDYGTITLLFQDNAGGLEVLHKSGQYVPATPIEDTIIVNIGDLLQRWTSDKLISTQHRVLVPEVDFIRKKVRRSMAYFLFPDDGHVVTCIDGSNKYPPIGALDYLEKIYSVTYST